MTDLLDKFDRAPDTPLYWYNCATDLRGAAAGLWWAMEGQRPREISAQCGLGEGFDVAIAARNVFPMLCGMSLELLYKAIAVAQRKKIHEHHNLIALCEHAGILLDDDEKAILALYSEAIYWQGRYPVPKQRKDWDKTLNLTRDHLFDRMPMGRVFVLKPNGRLDWLTFSEFWQKGSQAYWEHHFDA